ncbi:MAG TPA: hypothetical protein PKC69_06975 [Chitinophagaceae bacterium]|nr:hypothetical protein [Chitinophagaceae bacterium]
MTPTEQQVKRINEKLQWLIRQYAALQKENEQLKKEAGELKKAAGRSSELVHSLEQQVAVLKFSNADMSEEEKKAFEKKLGAYIKEIDRCIAMLSR